MKKKIVLRSLLGFPIGIAMGYVITIFISFGWANGYYAPCVPELIAVMGNGKLEYCKANRNLFFNYFRNHVTGGLFYVLDGT